METQQTPPFDLLKVRPEGHPEQGSLFRGKDVRLALTVLTELIGETKATELLDPSPNPIVMEVNIGPQLIILKGPQDVVLEIERRVANQSLNQPSK